MKRFWLLAVLMAGMLTVALSSPASAKNEDESSTDQSQSMEDVNSAMGSMSAHMNDIDKQLAVHIMGDVRVRDHFMTQQASVSGVTIMDSNRGRYRARLGVWKKSGDYTAKFRISTGTTAVPWSENQTFDTAFTFPGIVIDLASLTWEPSFANGMISITAGKMLNPLTYTDITWDGDITPEGVETEFKNGDFTLRGTYFELQPLFASGGPNGNIDLFMDNVQAEYVYKADADTVLGIMAGYEYIPNSTFLLASGIPTILGGKNPITSFGGVLDAGGAGRDWNNVEGMLYFKHKMGDVPFKWYLHVTDNLNGTNLPNFTAGVANGTYSSFSNQYAWLFGVDIGQSKLPGDWSGSIHVAQVDPNAQLPFLVEDDGGNTNRQYVMGSIGVLLEEGVVLKATEWLEQHEYYAVPGLASSSTLGGSSQNPMSLTQLDWMLSF